MTHEPRPAPASPGRDLDLSAGTRITARELTAVSVLMAAATLVMTWPLALGLGRDIPWDLGDPVLNCWILQRDADHLLRFLGGDAGALRGYFNGNIFYPEPLTLAYSEHLTAQALQILPLYAVTKNIVLCYNLLFLSTFVLSGLGAYLLVRSLTGSPRAALVAGLLYAFAPYRIAQFSHLQVLSSQWMPFALFALRRYFDTRRALPLAGAVAALVAQNLSCGYFLLYFSPFVAVYVLYELADRGAWRDWRAWGGVAVAGAAVTAVTVPFQLPYLELRGMGFGPRPMGEVIQYSADVYSYLVATEVQRAWGWLMRTYPKPEGELFPSLTPVALALVGILAQARRTWPRAAPKIAPTGGPRKTGDAAIPGLSTWVARCRRVTALVAGAAVVWMACSVMLILSGKTVDLSIGPLSLRARTLTRALQNLAVGVLAVAALSPRVRTWMRGERGSLVAFCAGAAIVAGWLSLGPVISSRGELVAADGLYGWFYAHVPGFDGLRVPARMAMLVALFLAVLGGYGAAAIERWWHAHNAAGAARGARLGAAAGSRALSAAMAAICLAFLIESTSAPIAVNGTWETNGLAPPPVPLVAAGGPPSIYRAVAALPPSAVVAEFPFGDVQYDLRYMVWSAAHSRSLLNGYSGGFPASFVANRDALVRVLEDPHRAWAALDRSGATHVIVHERFFLENHGARVSAWLTIRGASLVAEAGGDKVFILPAHATKGG